MKNNDTIEPTIKTVETFTAKFCQYKPVENGELLLNFIDIKDKKNNIIKPELYINAKAVEVADLIGNLVIGQEVKFRAQIVMHHSYPNGLDLINITFFFEPYQTSFVDKKIGNNHD